MLKLTSHNRHITCTPVYSVLSQADRRHDEMFNSPPSALLARNFNINLPPRATYSWESSRTLNDIAADGQTPISLEVEFEEDGSFRATVIQIEEEADQAQGTSARGRILRKIRIPIPKIETTVKGVAGLAGEVLPKGRLRGLMKSAITQQLMDALCWAVLYRYSIHNRCLPYPTHGVRNNAYQAIKRARQSVPPEMQLPYPPAGFWSRPVPETDSVCWPVTLTLKIQLLNKTLLVGMQRPLDELLDPAICPA